MDDQSIPEIDTDRKPQSSGGGSTAKVVGGIGAAILALLAGLARHADDIGRGVFRHADDFGRGASHFTDDMGRGAARFGDDFGHSARFGDDLGQTARFGEDATSSYPRFGQEMERFPRFGDDVAGSTAGLSDGFQSGSLPPRATVPNPVPSPTLPSESDHQLGARMLLRAGREAVRQSTGDRNRDEK